MKRYLIWSAYDFMQAADNDDILAHNRILSNSGNLAFHTSVVRALMTEGTTFTSVFFKSEKKITDAFITEANETYDAFILPLANAFRSSYVPLLRVLTKLVRNLKIPCIVTSIGGQFANRVDIALKKPWDADVRSFIAAVLEKSQAVGLRGEDTLAYLTRLGFAPEKEVRVTGCPSMFYFGGDLPAPHPEALTRDSLCMINTKLENRPSVHDFMNRSCTALPNTVYVAQLLDELRFMNGGAQNKLKGLPAYYPLFKGQGSAKDGRLAIGFTDFPAWIGEMKKAALCYGSNIHGVIPAVLAGTPAVIIEKDRRVAEIADYFGIPRITVEETAKYRDIRAVYEKADFAAVTRGHAERFDRCLALLHDNGLETVYDDPAACAPGSAPWDILHDSRGREGMIKFYAPAAESQRMKGLPAYIPMYNQLIKNKIDRKKSK